MAAAGAAGLVVAVVGLSATAPAAATDAGPDAVGPGSPTVEVIVSAPVDAGQAPQFEVVRTDLAGLVDLLESVDEDERVEWNGTAALTVRPSDPGFAHGAPAQRASLEAAWETTRGSADVVIAAAGVAHLVRPDWISAGATVLSVGITRTVEGILGDVHPGVEQIAGRLSGATGGVGPMTRAMLLTNVVECAEAYATLGEIMGTMESEFGRHVEVPVI